MKILAVYPGRFQPFHKGHAQVYQWLKNKFGGAVIATSNKVDPPKSPFNFQEKKQMMKLAGVRAGDVQEVVNPYIAKEVLRNYDPKTTVLVFAVSQKDMEEDPRFSFKSTKSGKPGYLQPYAGNEKKLKPFGDAEKPTGYVIVTPTFNFDVLGEPMTSASEFRANFMNANKKTQKAMITDLYGRYDEKVHSLMSSKIKKGKTLREMREVNIGMTLSRSLMPQVGASASFVKYLKDNSIDSMKQSINPNSLKSSQMEFDFDKIDGMRSQKSKNAIVISNDDYVLDGHHRWLADKMKNRNCDAYRVNLPILELMRVAKEYENKQNGTLSEEITHKKFGPMLDAFVSFASDKLGLLAAPKLSFDSSSESSFGGYNPMTKELVVATKNRHPMDVFRTVAHELVHHKQNEDGKLGKNIEKEGATGSDIENEANSEAGKIMRWFAKEQPQHFKLGSIVENTNSAAIGGVRGLGNVSGEVSPTGISQYVIDNQNNTTEGLWDFTDTDSWLDKKGIKEYQAKTFKVLRAKMSLNEISGTFASTAPKKEPESFMSSLPKVKAGAVTKVINRDISSNMPTLKDVPKSSESGATVTDIIINGKKQKSISINPNVGIKLEEGINDPGIFKAVFLAGGPGSGKDYVLKRTIEGNGLTEINSDIALEFLMKKNGLDFTMPEEEETERNIARGRAKNITREKQRLSILGRKGIVINGTADDPVKIATIKAQLEELGYDTMMVFVNTSDEVSKQRNIERGKTGGREVPENIRKEKWEAVQKARPEMEKLFGKDNFVAIDNSEDLRKAPKQVVDRMEKTFLDTFKKVRAFSSNLPLNPVASDWVDSELQRQNIQGFVPPKQSASYGTQKPLPYTPPATQSVMDKAKAMGLEYYGFGRFGKNRKVTHIEKGAQLVLKPQNIKEENVSEDLRNWFSKTHPEGNWKRVDTKGNIKGDCAREPGEGKPKCMPASKAYSMSKQERAKSAKRKRREDPVANRKGKGNAPIMVKTESVQTAIDKINRDRMSEEILLEKNVPTNPQLWSRAKSLARSKFDVYPSAYANGWAAKWYKSKGGGWKSKSVDEAFENFIMENTPSDREWGTTSLANIYKEGTPGQSETKKKILKKKLRKEDNSIALGYNFGNSGIGQEFGVVRSPNGLGFGYSIPMGGAVSMAESIVEWMNNSSTQQKFIDKYGNLAEQKLIETAHKLNEAGYGIDKSKPKSIKKIRESIKEPAEMGMIATQRKDEVYESSKEDVIDTSKIKSLKRYKKEIHPESEYEKETFKEDVPAWQRKEGQNPEGGLNRKGIASYRRANPGSKLSMAVTTKPSKLKPGSKAAKRRKSFCARMGGMKKRLTSAKTANDPDSRINKALRKWNCEE
jgi:dephospho-CoA kinase